MEGIAIAPWLVAQSVMSYFLAGMAKVKSTGWLNGHAVQDLSASDGPYKILAAACNLASNRLLCAVLD